ncbi:hypothetical protein SETIT_9G191100v2 [Setaria italica]|uniref:Uncharacterized protein n=1 Tax=Setaria italica TaxID=4555 RepID=A0A368SIA1_SETIT|nr:hypothetical protein SETIT_9G191100v2 [Setaria italica]
MERRQGPRGVRQERDAGELRQGRPALPQAAASPRPRLTPARSSTTRMLGKRSRRATRGCWRAWQSGSPSSPGWRSRADRHRW